MLQQTTAGGLFSESREEASSGSTSPGVTASSEQTDIAVYRLRSRNARRGGESKGAESHKEIDEYMWRRLFRIVDRPESPPIVLDCESLGLAATEKIAQNFWNAPDLWTHRNLILVASAASAWEEFVTRCRLQREDLIVGDNWGILILEEPQTELPALLRKAAELNGWIVTTSPTTSDKTKRIHCGGAVASANIALFGKRDCEMEKQLGIGPQ